MAQFAAQGRAEAESVESFRLTFCPIPEHLRALDPDVALVLGERGAGKSVLFRAANDPELLAAVVPFLQNSRVAQRVQAQSEWIRVYPAGTDFAGTSSIQRFVAARGGEAAADLWFAYLVRSVAPLLNDEDRERLAPLLRAPAGSADATVAAFRSLGDDPLIALDRLDRRTIVDDKYIVLAYDELDTLGGQEWATTVTLVQGLMSFWAGHVRRWSRLRPKIFLRSDLFRLQNASLGADLPKLAANRADLFWSDANLYLMLTKRLANFGEALREYVRESRLKLSPAGTLGYLPLIKRSEDAKMLIERMVGPYMGADNTKGLTFRWVLNHAQDGLNRALPRAFVNLFEIAAEIEQQNPRAVGRRLLVPASLRRAVDRVSELQVSQAQSSEWPWIAGLKQRLQSQQVPVERRRFEELLSHEWNSDWAASPLKGTSVRPPARDARELLERLHELGITRERTNHRIDVPDLYLAGLGLKRRGGVARR